MAWRLFGEVLEPLWSQGAPQAPTTRANRSPKVDKFVYMHLFSELFSPPSCEDVFERLSNIFCFIRFRQLYIKGRTFCFNINNYYPRSQISYYVAHSFMCVNGSLFIQDLALSLKEQKLKKKVQYAVHLVPINALLSHRPIKCNNVSLLSSMHVIYISLENNPIYS